jgi:addiction module RelE/StbE family toxin
MKISYTQMALNDLKRLHAFIDKHNPQAAMKAANRLKSGVERLAEFPLLGKDCSPNEEKEIVLRDLVISKYIVRYMLLSKEIIILRIWHGKEDKPL